MLTKKLSKHGNSLALVIDKPILELLGIDENTELVISTDGVRLRVTPATPENLERLRIFEEALEFTNREYGGALQELADS